MSDGQLRFPNVNEGSISGHLTRGVQMKYTQDGTAIATFGIANSKKWKDKNTGEWKERARFFDVEAWAGLAEQCERDLEKGCPVLINYELDFDQWTDKGSGGKRHGTRLVVRRIQRLDWVEDKTATDHADTLSEAFSTDDPPFSGAFLEDDEPF